MLLVIVSRAFAVLLPVRTVGVRVADAIVQDEVSSRI
jgi:hypothetical protein